MPPRIHRPKALTLPTPSPTTHCSSCLARAFSTTPRALTLRRKQMFTWLGTVGENFKESNKGPNYMGAYNMKSGTKVGGRQPQRGQDENKRQENGDKVEDNKSEDFKALEEAAVDDSSEKQAKLPERAMRPFPLNPHFVSQSVLSEALRMEVWKRVQIDKKSVREVSVELGIDMRRVGAVVRLVEVEKRMRAENQPLALPFARVMHSILPTTPYKGPNNITPHEPINDLPVHPLASPQLFYPTSESRAFNRTDAGRVFSAAPRLPDYQDIGQGGTDAPQPWEDNKKEIIGRPLSRSGKVEQRFIKGSGKHTKTVGQGEYQVLKPADARIPHPHLIAYEQDKKNPDLQSRKNARAVQARYNERLQQEAQKIETAMKRQKERDERDKQRIQVGRWEWVVTDVKAGDDVGERYGVPSQARRKGQIKIPTRVEV